jgi:hypothetical protein
LSFKSLLIEVQTGRQEDLLVIFREPDSPNAVLLKEGIMGVPEIVLKQDG